MSSHLTEENTHSTMSQSASDLQTLGFKVQIAYSKLDQLKPNARNPRKHSKKQIALLSKAIKTFGFLVPILADENNTIIAGHGRWDAARTIGLEQVPVIRVDHLTPAQLQAFMLADNRLAELSEFDEDLLAVHLKELSELVLDFDLDATGFEAAHREVFLQKLSYDDEEENEEPRTKPAITQLGDLWELDDHRLICGDALMTETYAALMGDQKASAIFTDPPYNLRIAGNVSGKGTVKHDDFVQASGELSEGAFKQFLTSFLSNTGKATKPGSIFYVCIDWRHVHEMECSRRDAELDLLNICVWVKANGGQGSLYRSQHEFIFVLRNGNTKHLNNVQLGRFGRNRTNVWNYNGANGFPKQGQESSLSLHPTVKPVDLVADAIQDCTKREDIVLDPFCGSGSTILAAERLKRRAFAIELDPHYVDTAIRRWQRKTGKKARKSNGEEFSALSESRRNG